MFEIAQFGVEIFQTTVVVAVFLLPTLWLFRRIIGSGKKTIRSFRP